MEKKYLELEIDRNLKPMNMATSFTKHSAELDADDFYKPYGWMKTDKNNSSFQSWFSDLNTIFEVIRACNEHNGFKTTVNIVEYDTDGNEISHNHTSFDDRIYDFKKQIDSGALAHSDVTLIVFKKKKEFSFDEAIFKEIYNISKM